MLLQAGSTFEGALLKIFDIDSFSLYRIDLFSYDVIQPKKTLAKLSTEIH